MSRSNRLESFMLEIEPIRELLERSWYNSRVLPYNKRTIEQQRIMGAYLSYLKMVKACLTVKMLPQNVLFHFEIRVIEEFRWVGDRLDI